MNLWLRLIGVLFKAFTGTRLDIWGEGRIHFRVWPNDLDTNLHMNNGRYLTIMDLGRVDLMIRTGVFRIALKRCWRPTVGAAAIRFRRPLAPFQRYTLRTKLLGWDEKWFYFQQIFELPNGELAAKAIVRALMRARDRSIPSAEVFEILQGKSLPSPPLPPEVSHLNLR